MPPKTQRGREAGKNSLATPVTLETEADATKYAWTHRTFENPKTPGGSIPGGRKTQQLRSPNKQRSVDFTDEAVVSALKDLNQLQKSLFN